MSNRKNIDKLYLSKFEGAEVAPPEDSWQNIASRLPEKKRERKAIPLWMRLAGAAAALLLLVSLGSNFLFDGPSAPTVNSFVSRQDIHKEIRLSSTDFTETMLQASMSLQKIMKKKEDAGVIPSKSGRAEKPFLALGKTTGKAAEEDNSGKKTRIALKSVSPELDGSDPFTGPVLAAHTDTPSNAGEEGENHFGKGVDPLAGDLEGISKEEISGENAIAQQLAAELLGSEEEVGEAAENRMSISTRVAPVFYENVGSGNAMGARMVGGETSGEVSFSYGINVAYQISDRIKVRSGINKLDLSFSTPGVPLATAMNSSYLLEEGDPTLMSRQVEGDLQQQINFIEVPMEVEYRLLDRRIGLNLIAGGSTLFLNGSNVSMNTGMRTTDLGQAENMERLNFSANLGLGLDYEVAPGFSLNLEPMFKYQLDSFSEDTGVQPYYLAIYSGIGFSF